jgi:hypothetical protein
VALTELWFHAEPESSQVTAMSHNDQRRSDEAQKGDGSIGRAKGVRPHCGEPGDTQGKGGRD